MKNWFKAIKQKIEDKILVLYILLSYPNVDKLSDKIVPVSQDKTCTHTRSSHYILHVYPYGEWTECNDGEREMVNADLKCKCSTCNEVFIKRNTWAYRNKYTHEILY